MSTLSRPSRPASGLRYPSDAWTVLHAGTALALSLLPVLTQAAPHPGWGLYWLALLAFRIPLPCAHHNHGHLKTFRSPGLNLAFEIVLAQVAGYANPVWELHHNRGHHRRYLDPERDVEGSRYRNGGRTLPKWRYILRGCLMIVPESFRIALEERAQGRSGLLGSLLLHLGIQLAFSALWIAINPWAGVMFFLVQNTLLRAQIWNGSYWHHLDLPATHTYDGSHTKTGAWFNRLSYNSGHHTAHHEKPTLHWSQLPKRTREIAHRIPRSSLSA